jgi:hypothetical protein
MGEKGGLYALDGATSDLHLADVENLLGLPASRSSSSSTTRGWRTPTGSSTRVPAAGHDGGRIVFEGTPADLVAARSTLTGEHLAVYVGGGAEAVASR